MSIFGTIYNTVLTVFSMFSDSVVIVLISSPRRLNFSRLLWSLTPERDVVSLECVRLHGELSQEGLGTSPDRA